MSSHDFLISFLLQTFQFYLYLYKGMHESLIVRSETGGKEKTEN